MTNSFHLFELVLIFIIVVFLKLNNVIATIVCALNYWEKMIGVGLCNKQWATTIASTEQRFFDSDTTNSLITDLLQYDKAY